MEIVVVTEPEALVATSLSCPGALGVVSCEGVPLNTKVAGLKDNPVGKKLLVTDTVLPILTPTVNVRGVPTVPCTDVGLVKDGNEITP